MDVKSELKLARDAIKRKELKEATKHCKNVLKIDKENYTALVFIGKCATELEHYEQAKQAYNKAIGVNSELLLAWQGLSSLLETAKNATWNDELVGAYTKLLKGSEKEKSLEILNKLVKLLKSEKRCKEAIPYLLDVACKTEDEEEAVVFWKDIIQILTDLITSGTEKKDDINELNSIFVKALEHFEESTASNHHEMFVTQYLQFLLRYSVNKQLSSNDTTITNLPPLSNIFESAKTFQEKYPNNEPIATSFCKILLNYQLVNERIFSSSCAEFLKKITTAFKPSCFAYNVIQGFVTMTNKEYHKAISFFKSTLEVQKTTQVYYLLAACHHSLHQDKMTQTYISKCLTTPTVKLEFVESQQKLAQKLDFMQVEMLLEEDINEIKANIMKEIIGKYGSGDTASSVDALLLQVRVHLKLNDVGKATETLVKFDSIPDDAFKLRLLELKAELSLHEKKYYDAELRIQEALEIKETYWSHFLLGNVYWALAESNSDYYPKAYAEFLKAAKLDTMYAPTFYYLGRYQKDFIKDTSKAMKCLEKAHSLNSGNAEASKMLADIYLQMNKEDKAVDIYVKVTTDAKVGECTWAWLRLGLIYSKRKMLDKAIPCYQNALRGDITISHHWECLAEALFDKGSFTSALKAFNKAVELDPTSCYAKFKVAKIKQMLRMDVDAIKDYQNLLQDNTEYVPALLGIAETYLHLQREKLKMAFDGRAVEYAQNVVDYINRAVEKEPAFSILWKTVADALVSLFVVCHDKCSLSIPRVLRKVLSIDVERITSKATVLDLATRCYMVAIKLKEDISSYWHDLAIATYYHGINLKGEEAREKIGQSLQIVKKSLSLDVNNPVYWNTLGVISGSSGPSEKCCGHSIDDLQDPALSQHAFIKALELNPHHAQVWVNLGVLYLKHDKIKVAHEAFKKAQACDPTLTQAWIGQAMIAETIASDEAMDLFRHSTELQFHGEGSFAYAQWVCKLLHILKNDSVLVGTTPKADMSHLPVHVRVIVSNASVALQKSTERYKDNAFAFNTLGLLLEHEGLYHQAEKAFASARSLLSSQQSDNLQNEKLRKSLLNQARVLSELGKHENAIEVYKVCDLQTAREVCLLALVYYHAGEIGNSIKEYEKALAMCTTDNERSDVLSALGMVQYVQQNNDAAKSFLFESTQLKECSEHGIMALAALGLLHGDGKLAIAALDELSKHKQNNTKLFERKKTMLMSALYKLQSQMKSAKAQLLKAIRKYPNEPYFWSQLSKFIMEHEATNHHLSVHCTQVANTQEPSQISSNCEAMTSLAFPSESPAQLKRSVLRLVHSHPENAVSWVLLAASMNAEAAFKGSGDESVVQMTRLALTKVDKTLTKLRNSPKKLPVRDIMEIALYSNLYSWTMQLYVLTNIYYGDVTVAQAFCDNILPTLKGDNKAFEEFVFLKGLASIQESMLKEEEPSIENVRVMATLALKSLDDWKWQVLSDIYNALSMPAAAELCFKQRITQSKQNLKPYNAALLRCFINCIKARHVSSENRWLEKSQELVSEIIQSSSDTDHVVLLLRAVIFYQQGNMKAAFKYLQKLAFADGLIGELVQKFQESWKQV